MTREHDEEVSLQARSQAVIDYDADIVLSIHHNALPIVVTSKGQRREHILLSCF